MGIPYVDHCFIEGHVVHPASGEICLPSTAFVQYHRIRRVIFNQRQDATLYPCFYYCSTVSCIIKEHPVVDAASAYTLQRLKISTCTTIYEIRLSQDGYRRSSKRRASIHTPSRMPLSRPEDTKTSIYISVTTSPRFLIALSQPRPAPSLPPSTAPRPPAPRKATAASSRSLRIPRVQQQQFRWTLSLRFLPDAGLVRRVVVDFLQVYQERRA